MLDLISWSYGWIPDLIRYRYSRKVYRHIDKKYFLEKLSSLKHGLTSFRDDTILKEDDDYYV